MTDLHHSPPKPAGRSGQPDLIDDMRWRGLVQDSTDPDELRRHLDGGPVTFYVGFDPTGGQPARRPPDAGADRTAPAAGRPPAAAAGRRRDRPDRRPAASQPSACSTRRRSSPAGCERIREQLAPFVTYERRQRRRPWSTTWTGPARMSVDRVPPRRRQALPGQQDARPRRGARTAWRPASATPSSATSCCSPTTSTSCTGGTAARCSSAAPTSGATSPPASTSSAVAAAARCTPSPRPLVLKADGTKFGKTEGGVDLARPADDLPVRVLPVLGQRRRPGRRPATCGTSASGRPTRSRSWRRRRPSGRRPGWRSARWPRSSPPWCTARRRPGRRSRPARRSSAAGRWRSSPRTRCARRWPRPG